MSGCQSRLARLSLAICFLIFFTGCDSDQPTTGAAHGIDESLTGASPLDISRALDRDASLTLTVELNGTMVLPAVATRESALADVLFDRTNKRLIATLTATVERPLDVHIHEGGAGEVGAEVAALYADQLDYTLGDGVILSDYQSALMESGNLYIDVHTAEYPSGLLRAQLTASEIELPVLPSLADIQAKVFTPVCSGCHMGEGRSLPGAMNLATTEHSYQSLVGVFSVNEPVLLRVEPGNLQDSLLLRKIEGTHTVGSRMPLRGAKLDDQAIAAIRNWIIEGAAR